MAGPAETDDWVLQPERGDVVTARFTAEAAGYFRRIALEEAIGKAE